MLVLSALIPLIETTKVKFVRVFQYSVGAFMVIYLLVFTTFSELLIEIILFLERINESNTQIIENAELLTF